MQKKADNKQIWMTADRSNGSVIGNAQVGIPSGARVIGNAVIGGMAACCGTEADLAVGAAVPGAASGDAEKSASGVAAKVPAGTRRMEACATGSTMIGNAAVAGGVVGNAVVGGMAVGSPSSVCGIAVGSPSTVSGIAAGRADKLPLVPKKVE